MSKVLLLGAGRSVPSLVIYLQKHAVSLNLNLRIGDADIKNAEKIANLFPGATCFQFDITSNKSLLQEIRNADLVISMLPAHFHGQVAKVCIDSGVNMATASYTNAQIKSFDEQAKNNDVIVLMECGLDPGIDHMSAMKELDDLRSSNAKLLSFKSFTGGLIAPESDNNPWNYKFTWNPRNVVLAGQGVVKFKRNNKLKYIPYNSLFKRLETISVTGLGGFEGYANRDSLKYIEEYNLHDCPTVFRGTLRRPGFAKAWGLLLTLGLTNDTFQVKNSLGMSYREFLNSFLVYHDTKSVEEKIKEISADESVFEKLEWLELFSDKLLIESENSSPAQILQEILEKKWQLQPEDKDMVVMQHKIEYEIENKKYLKKSSLVVKGENSTLTSMAQTVGLPLGIAVKLILENRIESRGICSPTTKEFYNPILDELESYGIEFKNELVEI